METDEANFRAFYKERRREKYLREEAQLAGGVISLNAIDSDELDGVGVVADTSEPLDEKIMRKIMIEKLPEAISVLSDEEKEIIRQLYFNHISERDLGKITQRSLFNSFFVPSMLVITIDNCTRLHNTSSYIS